MILARGKLYESESQENILARMEEEIARTILSKRLPAETVIEAVEQLGEMIAAGMFEEQLTELFVQQAESYVDRVVTLLSRENLEYKMRVELGQEVYRQMLTGEYEKEPEKVRDAPISSKKISTYTMPLGTLFHIAAGNVDGLPAYSLVEGLLTGNINILKLPQADRGLSLAIIAKLIEIRPEIADFVYVFDTPSSDLQAMKKMAEFADGIVVWGGDEAVTAVRHLAKPGVRLVEWGHKLSFAYISGYEEKDRELKELAEHIIFTKQLLCSSCQVIYLDTQKKDEVSRFCEEFLPYMEEAALHFPVKSPGEAAEITLRRYNRRLEKIIGGDTGDGKCIYQGHYTSLTARWDEELELSDLFGNCLVKPLPKERLVNCLIKYKGNLQTAGLICEAKQRKELTEMLVSCGVVRITKAGNMSMIFSGEAHDGEYPLQRYVRSINVEY